MKKVIENLDEYFLMMLLAISTTIIFLQVIMRYLFSQSLYWSEEVARYMYVWQTWLSAGYAVRKRRHLRITTVVDKMCGTRRVHVEMLVITLWFGFSVFLGLKSVSLCLTQYEMGQVSTAIALPMWIAYLSIPTGAFFMAYRLIMEFIGCIRALHTLQD